MPPAAAMPTVMFEVTAETRWGDSLVLVGASTQAGAWDPQRTSLQLTTESASYPVWWLRCQLDLQSELEYKFVILRAADSGIRSIDWEPLCLNRRLVASQNVQPCLISAVWGEPGEKLVGAALQETPSSSTSAAPSCTAAAAPAAAPAIPVSPFKMTARPPISASFSIPQPPDEREQARRQDPALQRMLHDANSQDVSGPQVALFGPGPMPPIESLDQSWPPSCATLHASSCGSSLGSGEHQHWSPALSF